MKIINILLSFCLATILVSCNRDNLYFATEEFAIVKIEVDWNKSQLDPNGVSAYVFDHNSGAAVGDIKISDDPNLIYLALPKGSFDIFLLNDTESELENIDFADISDIGTFKALITSYLSPAYSNIKSSAKGAGYAKECDILAIAKLDNIEITQREIYYYLEKPSNGEYTVSKAFTVTPERVTELIDIEISVRNINSAAGAPRTHLTSIVGGIYLDYRRKVNNSVTLEFVLNNKVADPYDEDVAKISKKLISFGPLPDNSAISPDFELIMNFILIDGSTYPVTIRLCDLVTTSYDGLQVVHTIRTDITLPAVIGNGDGVFNPDIEEWEDVQIELPI